MEVVEQTTVGEAISLPRGTTLQNGTYFGEFAKIANILPFNQPLKNVMRREADSLPYSGWVLFRLAKFQFDDLLTKPDSLKWNL